MSYSTIDKPTDYFNTKLYAGNSSSGHSITGVGFQPDWTWIKERDASNHHILVDAVRGATKYILANDTQAEVTSSNYVSSFNSDGFTVGSDAGVNRGSMVAWNWKAGTGQGSSNTDGSINTAYTSVNTTAGFSISSYTGTGNVATVGHGLGVKPDFVIIKELSNANSWFVYHQSLGATHYLYLNDTDASAANSNFFQNTEPTSTLCTIGTDNVVNRSSSSYIMYAFAEVQGFSKMGSYTGNGSTDGTFIYTGFKPAFVMSKCTSHAGEDWNINDDKRPGYNVIQNALLPNSDAAEVTASFQAIDTLSNGFKWRGTNDRVNASGKSYIYMAFADSPFVGSNFNPATAR